MRKSPNLQRPLPPPAGNPFLNPPPNAGNPFLNPLPSVRPPPTPADPFPRRLVAPNPFLTPQPRVPQLPPDPTPKSRPTPPSPSSPRKSIVPTITDKPVWDGPTAVTAAKSTVDLHRKKLRPLYTRPEDKGRPSFEPYPGQGFEPKPRPSAWDEELEDQDLRALQLDDGDPLENVAAARLEGLRGKYKVRWTDTDDAPRATERRLNQLLANAPGPKQVIETGKSLGVAQRYRKRQPIERAIIESTQDPYLKLAMIRVYDCDATHVTRTAKTAALGWAELGGAGAGMAVGVPGVGLAVAAVGTAALEGPRAVDQQKKKKRKDQMLQGQGDAVLSPAVASKVLSGEPAVAIQLLIDAAKIHGDENALDFLNLFVGPDKTVKHDPDDNIRDLILKSVGEPLTRETAGKQLSDIKTKVAKALPDLPFTKRHFDSP